MHNTSRYDRQERYAGVGVIGQSRLAEANVLVVGVGALGSVVAELLARAGIGHLRLVDRDTVELSNLQRQSLYDESDAAAGLAKTDAASRHLQAINSSIAIEPYALDVTAANLPGLVEGIDIIVDGTDNFQTRFLINDVSLRYQIPWVHGGCLGAGGQVFTFWPGTTICWRCLVPEPPSRGQTATCDTAGVLGPATHLIASLQAGETIRALVEGAATARHQITSVDLWEGRWRSLETGRLLRVDCPACQQGQLEFLSGTRGGAEPEVLCGRDAVQIPAPEPRQEMDLARLAASWEGLGQISQNRFLARLTLVNKQSVTVFRDGRAVIGGTEELSVAKSLYARFVGI